MFELLGYLTISEAKLFLTNKFPIPQVLGFRELVNLSRYMFRKHWDAMFVTIPIRERRNIHNFCKIIRHYVEDSRFLKRII